MITFIFMEALIVYPENKQPLNAVKAVMKAMKVAFVQQDEQLPDHVLTGVKKSLKQANEGQLTPYSGIRDMFFQNSYYRVNKLAH